LSEAAAQAKSIDVALACVAETRPAKVGLVVSLTVAPETTLLLPSVKPASSKARTTK
jgi:hypothetical protein